VALRFLQLIERTVYRDAGPAGLLPVDTLDVDGRSFLTWDEAIERRVMVTAALPLADPLHQSFEVAAGSDEEALPAATGARAGALIRTWRALHGRVVVTSEAVEPGLHRLTVEVTNTTPWTPPASRLLASTLLATHLVLGVDGGQWVSLTDPPEPWADAVAACRNIGTWPVLVGEPGDRSTLLAAPIVLYDYPQVAPESPGDFFDATEIDEMLVLNVLGLTEDERREVAAGDPRARQIVERCAAMSVEDVMRLHGVLRDPRVMPGA
jgi:hydrogenase maturation protease